MIIYSRRKRTPKFVGDVDAFFRANKKKEWFNEPFVKEMIKAIDNTIVVKDKYLERDMKGLKKAILVLDDFDIADTKKFYFLYKKYAKRNNLWFILITREFHFLLKDELDCYTIEQRGKIYINKKLDEYKESK